MGRKNKAPAVSKPPLSEQALEEIIIKAVILFFVAVLIYIPAMNGGYIYDDDQLLYKNLAIRRGVGWDGEAWKGLKSLWLPIGEDAAVSADYAPLSSSTLWLEWRLWGNNKWDDDSPDPEPRFRGWGAPGYHITNIILHGISALLLWYLLAQMGIPGAWLAGLVWAVHPVGVESVAWISERRNPMSMALYMLTMINWFKYQRTKRPGVYALAVFLFVLTMLAKTSIVMLPLVLVLCTWWERGWQVRLDWRQVLEFLFAELIFVVWLVFATQLGQLWQTKGLIAFVLLVTPALGLFFRPIYMRLTPFWRGVINFQVALLAFVLWFEVGAGLWGVSWPYGLVLLLLVVSPVFVFALKLINDRLEPVWRQVLPFFMISYIFAKITLYFQNDRAIAREMVFIGNFFERFCGACFALAFYFYKIILPVRLNLIYQQWHKMLPWSFTTITQELNIEQEPHIRPPYSLVGLSEELILGVIFAGFFYWAWRKRDTWGRHAILGVGSFAFMISPVLGFTRMAYMRLTLVSDHFDYAPMIGVIALCVAGLIEVNKRLQPSYKPVLVGAAAGIIVMFGVLTWQRARIFADPESLWRDNIGKNSDSWQGHSHLGAILWRKHDLAGALHEWQQSAELAPYLYEVHNNYGLVLNALGRIDESLEQYKIAVGIEPMQFQVRANYAQALYAAHHFQESAQQYMGVLQYSPPNNPNNPLYYNSMGVSYFQIGKIDEAIACFAKAVQLAPKYTDAQHNLDAARFKKQEMLEK